MTLSLSARLSLTLVLTLLIALVMGAAFAVHHGKQAVESEIRSSVDLALRLMDAGNADTIVHWLSPLAHAQRTRHLRIQVLHNEQPVLVSPTASAPTLSAPAWFARWVTPAPLRIERRFSPPDGPPLTVVIQADPRDEIAELWEETLGFIRLLGLLAITLYGIIHIMLGRAFRSVGVILKALEGIEAGDYSARLPRFALPEFAQLAQTFNHMAAALEKAQQENRTLTQRSLSIQEEERRGIAQELHDELGQSLSAIKALSVSLRGMVPSAEGREILATIGKTCDHLFALVRTRMRRLRPIMLEELGLTASLEDLIASWKTCHPGIRISFHCEPAVEQRAGAAKIHLFRIVQECLTNISRHAMAHTVHIRLSAPEEAQIPVIRLEISDDGRGFDPTLPRSGFGLYGMRERTLSLGGRFDLEAHPGRGVRLTITLPCQHEAHTDDDTHPTGG